MNTTEKIALINDILNCMHNQLKQSHKYVDESDFQKLLELYNGLPNREVANKLWQKHRLPADFKFQPNKFPIDEEICAWLHPEYCQAHGINMMNPAPDFHFRLTADEIIKMGIPPRVAACTGHAKLFCHFAQAAGLECWTLLTADLPKRKTYIDGHQIIAVKLDGKLVAFDPAINPMQQIPGEIECGKKIQSIAADGFPKYTITGLVPRDKIDDKIKSYQDLEELYLGRIADKFKSATRRISDIPKPQMPLVVTTEYE